MKTNKTVLGILVVGVVVLIAYWMLPEDSVVEAPQINTPAPVEQTWPCEGCKG